MKLLSPNKWLDYQLIDCGNFEKLEKFGPYTLIRPEPQAIWDRSLGENVWKTRADARFERGIQSRSYRAGSQEKGGWKFFKKIPSSWPIKYPLLDRDLVFKISLTSFGHVGIFPEQAVNWEYVYYQSKNFKEPKILNLFAYTGGASLAARAAGADVVHLDSVKQVVGWARENMQQTGLDRIRWVVEDAKKYVEREVKRGNKYHGIILDPPAYGRGPKGEKWTLEDGLNQMIRNCSKLLVKGGFLLLNMYSIGYSSLVANNLAEGYFRPVEKEFGELFLQSSTGIQLPLGTFLRFNLA